MHGLSDERAEYLIKDRLSFMRFLCLRLVSRIHRKKPQGRPVPKRTRRANARKSAVRSKVEHVFAHQKGLMRMSVRIIGIARAKVKIGLSNLVYNIRRLVWLSSRTASALPNWSAPLEVIHPQWGKMP